MSAVGAWLARAFASLGGPQTAVAVLVAGVVAGGLGGYAITNSQRASSPTANAVAVFPCPNQGPALLTVAGGQQLLVTGRLADASWLRIHLPEPGRTEGWVKAGPLTVNGSVDSLPVVSCEAVAGPPSPAIAPYESMTAVVNATPSPGPTPTPSPSPTPSPTPNAHPVVTALTASTGKISYDQGSYCPTAVTKVTFSVKASDASGIASVALWWRAPGASRFTPAAMTRTAGTATSGTWQASLDTTANGLTTAGNLNYYALATDTAGATTQLPSPGSKFITVAICSNTGPSITSVTSSSGSSLYWDPLGVGSCQTATNITTAVKDIDGLKSVTLFFRRPGSSTWSSKAMDNQTVPGKWYANLDTLGDKISIPSPPTGTLSWYIKATDNKNLASQTRTSSTTIRRCDSEATFDGVFPTSSAYSCTTATISIATYANDRDQPENGLKVVFYWTLSNPRTNPTPISGHMSASFEKGNYYQGTTASFNGKTFYYGVLTVYAVTTDKYGGTTTSRTYTTTMACR